MTTRADILFTYDARGRMLRTNEPEAQPAPRLFVGRTAGGNVIRFGETVSDAVARELAKAIERHPSSANLAFPQAILSIVQEILSQQTSVIKADGGPAYRFPDSTSASNQAVQLDESNLDLVRETYPWLYRELPEWQPCFAVVRDGAAVSVCFSSRIGNKAAEAGVHTLPDFRGRGYAVKVTAAWGAAVHASGRIPLYSTAWDNIASQAVAKRLGLVMFGVDATWI